MITESVRSVSTEELILEARKGQLRLAAIEYVIKLQRLPINEQGRQCPALEKLAEQLYLRARMLVEAEQRTAPPFRTACEASGESATTMCDRCAAIRAAHDAEAAR